MHRNRLSIPPLSWKENNPAIVHRPAEGRNGVGEREEGRGAGLWRFKVQNNSLSTGKANFLIFGSFDMSDVNGCLCIVLHKIDTGK